MTRTANRAANYGPEPLDRADLHNGLVALLRGYGYLTDRTYDLIDSLIDSVATEPEPRTIFVVTWEPTSVGGFEWRTTRETAERVAEDFRKDDDTVQVHTVELPDDVGDDPEGITAWLDSEGWSDGIDPRSLPTD